MQKWFHLANSRTWIGPEHQTAWSKLTLAEANVVLQEILLELARAKMAYTIVGSPLGGSGTQSIGAMQNITIQRPVPLANNYNEGRKVWTRLTTA